MSGALKAPFPWFGGKSRVADLVWQRFGDVRNYVEPFAGSLAVLLGRPAEHQGRVETVNDLDGFIANFWRATRADPEAVAEWADWPVNENDQHARHVWLVSQRDELTRRLEGSPGYYDAQIAGWWVWGICCWIGSGWCSGKGPWQVDDSGKLVHLGDAGQGVHRQLVHLGDAGRGVHRQLVHLGNAGQGLAGLYAWFEALAERLRYVRVCSGDWGRVLGPTTYKAKLGLTGVFLDPPYPASDQREMGIYAVDDGDVGHAVREWAVAHGADPLLRIALCGYNSQELPSDWTAVPWKAAGGYGSQGKGRGGVNAGREVVWFSPGCLPE